MRSVGRALVTGLLGAVLLVPGPAGAGERVSPVVTAADAWVDYGKVGLVSVTVAAEGATPTGEVTARLGDRVLGTGELVDGAAVVEVPARALLPRATPYDLTVSYAGSATVAGGTDDAALKVRRGRALVWATVTPRRVAVGEGRVTAVVEVLNGDGVPRAGVVKLSAAGAGSRSAAIQGGRATLRLPPFGSAGEKTVVVGYAGSTLLRPARATYAVLAVASAPTPARLSRIAIRGSHSVRTRSSIS